MTDRSIRREFLKTAAASIAVLAIRPTRDGNAFFDIKSERDQTPESQIIIKALRTWRPDPALKIRGFEVAVSEHVRFLYNQLAVKIRAETRLEPPSRGEPFAFFALPLISRLMLEDTPEFAGALHRTLNGGDAFHWVRECNAIPTC